MKFYTLLMVFLMSCLMAVGAELTEKEKEKIEDKTNIGSVNDNTVRGDDDEKSEVLKFHTYQEENDVEKYEFRMRVTVELTDKKKNTVFVQFTKEQGAVDSEYTGQDNWKFSVPHGGLEKPKLTAYVVQYGVLNEGEFVVILEETKRVKSLEELTERSPTRHESKMTAQHQYTYRDGKGGDIQSPWK